MVFNPVLHGLRGVAALMVMVYHWSGVFPGFVTAINHMSIMGCNWDLAFLIKMGWQGVDWFFVLSGFVLTGTLWNKKQNIGSTLQFWLRRAARIFPALWVQIALLLTFWYVVGWVTSVDWRQVFSNAILWLRPLPGGARSLNGVYWTLPVEFSFYLLLPFLFFLYRRVHILLLIGLAVAFQLFGKFAGWFVPYSDLVYPFWRYVYPFFSGIQLAFIVGMGLHLIRLRLSELQRRLVFLALLLAYLTTLAVMNQSLAEYPRAHWIPLVWRMGVTIVIGAIIWTLLQPMRGTAWLASRPMVWLGEVSFGIYLWHFPVQIAIKKAAQGFFDGTWLSLAALILTTAVTLVLAALSYQYVERPAIRWAARKSEPIDGWFGMGRRLRPSDTDQ